MPERETYPKAIMIIDGGYLDKQCEAYFRNRREPLKRNYVPDFTKLKLMCLTMFKLDIVQIRYYHAPPGLYKGEDQKKLANSRWLEAISEQRFQHITDQGVEVKLGVTIWDKKTSRYIQKQVDVKMAVDMVHLLHKDPSIDTFLVFSGDGDLVPAFDMIKEEGGTPICVAHQNQLGNGLHKPAFWRSEQFSWEDFEALRKEWKFDKKKWSERKGNRGRRGSKPKSAPLAPQELAPTELQGE